MNTMPHATARPIPKAEVPIPEWTDDDADDAGFELAEWFDARADDRFDA
jgi:hypothetical protein